MTISEDLAARLAKYNKPSKKTYINKTGYWISPKGKITDTDSKNHIDQIISSPSTFNITAEYIKSEHKKYGESIGQEGDARDNIMTKVLQDGWIRVRARRNFISVQVWEFSRTTTKNLEAFAVQGLESGFSGEFIQPNEMFKVSSLSNGRARQVEVESLAKGGLVESCEFDVYSGFLIQESMPTFKQFINRKIKELK
jgi:hypothetical protein